LVTTLRASELTVITGFKPAHLIPQVEQKPSRYLPFLELSPKVAAASSSLERRFRVLRFRACDLLAFHASRLSPRIPMARFHAN
jgi:AmiR/NasT family two-component response regulator